MKKKLKRIICIVMVLICLCMQGCLLVGISNCAEERYISIAEKYMQEHTVSKEDIEALFTDDTIVLDCGDASSHAAEKTPDSSTDTISLAGARTIVEELAKRLPKVEWGDF